MDAIRNYTQHRAFPAHGSEYVTTVSLSRRQSYGVEFFFKTKEVKGDRFKKSVLGEIEADDGQVELAWCVRLYFAKICEIHEQVRGLIKEIRSRCEGGVYWARNEWKEGSFFLITEKIRAYRVIDGVRDETAPVLSIDPETDSYRIGIERRTGALADMKLRRVDMYGADVPEVSFNRRYSRKRRASGKKR